MFEEYLKSDKKLVFKEFVSEFGGVIERDGIAYAVTSDGEQLIPIPEDIASLISLALRAQNRVQYGNHPKLGTILDVLNCRKTALVASGSMSLSEALDKDETLIDGLGPLFDDVDRIQNDGYVALEVTESPYKKIKSYLDKYEGGFPCIVHLFEIDKNSSLHDFHAIKKKIDDGLTIERSVIEKMHRMHSFLILGEDEEGYVCFQKNGPNNDPFMIIHLYGVTLTNLASSMNTNRLRLAFIGPISRVCPVQDLNL